MIETILHIVKLLVALLPFVLFCLCNNKLNLEKPERSRQFPMLLITLVYVIVAMILMDSINDWLIDLINSIPAFFEKLAKIGWMPEFLTKIFKAIGKFIRNFINHINLFYWIFFISNTVIVIAYLALKSICMKFIKKFVKPEGELHTKVASNFYRFFFERNLWCLKDSFVQVRSFLKTFYYSAMVILVLLMLVSTKLYQMELMKTIFYPVFGILIMAEMYFYLDGVTQKEYSTIMGEDDEAYRMVNYSLLRKFLRSLFKDKLLSENTSLNSALSYNVSTDDIILELEKSEDQKITSFASYVKMLHKSGFPIDHNYLYSSLDMLNGKSTLFNNPFYKDLIPYAFYPMNRALLSHQKVLVVLGRHAIEDDMREWVEEGISAVTHLPFMWDIEVLDTEAKNPDIGIITRSDVLDIRVHNANADFFEEVGFVVIIEPSKLITTAQIGLNMIIKQCRNRDDKNIVYCMCDKNCDGLVDAMSHILMTSITEVSATNKHTGTSSYMNWEADKEYLHHRLLPNISRYLGMGTELSFAALKNQVSKVEWYGGEAFPVSDIRWIDRQYYYDLTKYAGLPTNQESMDEYFHTTPNFWSAEVEKNKYLTVEDEDFNMFEVLRDFSTRATEQGFINVISSEYLLKDYMADNASIFQTDAKAIPYIVADYARSNRNATLRLILMMSCQNVSMDTLEKELSLLGITVYDLKKQLWYEIYKCFATVSELDALTGLDYEEAVKKVSGLSFTLKNGHEVTSDIFRLSDSFSLKLGKMQTTLEIRETEFLNCCVSELLSASYVAEDEKGQMYYLGAELCGHIYQKYLPGQFFTFGGKYYEMQYLTADGQVLVRRAADHITGRPSYRQIRNYKLLGIKPSDRIGAIRDVAGLKIATEFADITVDTPGYYKMERYNDFASAKKVEFEGRGIPQRSYRNKEILRIELPSMDGKLNERVRYTMTMLFNEIFKTLFAENQSYICAVTPMENGVTDGINPVTYTLAGEGVELNANSIYIIEDSQLDLGLTIAVERNLQRIMEIMDDYLSWHNGVLENSIVPPAPPKSSVVFSDTPAEQPKKKGFFAKILEKIKNIFKKKPKSEDKPETPAAETDPVPADDTPAPVPAPTGDTPDPVPAPTGDTPAEDTPADETPAADETDGEPVAEETPAAEETPSAEEVPEKPKKKGFFAWLAGLFKGKKKKKTEEAPEESEAPVETEIPEETPEEAPAESEAPELPEGTPEETPEEPVEESIEETAEEETPVDEEESADNAEGHEQNAPADVEHQTAPTSDDEPMVGIIPERKPYHERYYLLFGDVNEPFCIDQKATKSYLDALGFGFNPLSQAREGKNISKIIEATYKPGKANARYCDFCGTEIFGVEYETLADGRDRCLHCSKTAIKTGEEFKKIFEDVRRNMESFFGIRLNVGVKVEMVNSKTLHKRLGESFTPTPDSDGRVLGVAIKDKNGFSLLVENGSPRMASICTIAHELTHIWQYVNWDRKKIRKKYGKGLELEIYEGMAKWVEVQYAYLINDPALAKRTEIMTSFRDDEYGRGFMRYRANYPFSIGTIITKVTPFMDTETPLAEDYCGTITVIPPKDDGMGLPEDDDTPKGPTGGVPTGVIPTAEDAVVGPSERDFGNAPKFFYNRMNENEKTVYNLVLDAIENYKTEISDFGVEFTLDTARKVMDYVLADHPEIFWFYYNETYLYNTETMVVGKISFEYRMTREEAENRKDQIEASVQPFLDSISDTMSDYEVVKKVYENIIDLVDYDTIGLERQKKIPRNERSTQPDDLRSIYGVFVSKKAVCAGYAKALQFLLNILGIECVYVTSETHAWNLVKVEGDYYHIDVTWGDGTDTKNRDGIDAVDYGCFCITTEEVLRLDAHKPEAVWNLPVCTAVKCNYHRRHGLYFESYDEEKIRNIVCESISRGQEYITFKFATDALYNQAKNMLVDGRKFMDMLRYANLKTDKQVDLRYTYIPSPEKRILNFYLKNCIK